MKKLIWLALLLPFTLQAHAPDPVWGHALTLKDMPKECQSGIWNGGPVGLDPWYPNGTTVWSVNDGLLNKSDITAYGGVFTGDIESPRLWIGITVNGGETGLLNVSFFDPAQRVKCSFALISAGLI